MYPSRAKKYSIYSHIYIYIYTHISGLKNRQCGCRDPSRWPRGTLYPQKLALTSPTSGGHLVGIVRSWTQAKEFVRLGEDGDKLLWNVWNYASSRPSLCSHSRRYIRSNSWISSPRSWRKLPTDYTASHPEHSISNSQNFKFDSLLGVNISFSATWLNFYKTTVRQTAPQPARHCFSQNNSDRLYLASNLFAG
jgi:hypothetical protein